MIKILYFQHNSSIGGAPWSLFQLINALDRRIFEPVVVLPERGPLGAALEGIGVKVIVHRRLKPFLNTPTAKQLHYTNIIGLWHCFGAISAAREICESLKPNIVHINTSVLFHLAKGARMAGVAKVIVHARENWELNRFDPRNVFKDWILESSVDVIISICKESGTRFAPKLPHRINVIHNWPDFEGRDGFVNLFTAYGIDSSRKIVLAPSGRLSIKGALDAVLAMERVHDPGAVLLVLGGQPDKNILKIRIRKLLRFFHFRTYGLTLDLHAERLKGKVVLAEWSLNVRSIMKQSMLVLCPFNHPHFSKAAIEAGSLGKPVVISDDAYGREAVLGGETGILVPKGDTTALANAINQLLENIDVAERMGKNARQYTSTHFNRDVSIQKLLAIYLPSVK